MKRILVCLGPWMVVMATAQQVLRPAAVNFGYRKTAQVWRSKDECWASPAVLIGWGWPYRFSGNEATIEGEGRTLRVTGRTIDGKFLLPLHDVFLQLGAVSGWEDSRDIFFAHSQIRRISVRQGKLSVDGTTTFQPTMMLAENPTRLIFDIKGARLGDNFQGDYDSTVRAAQYSPDTVRIAMLVSDRPAVTQFAPAKNFEYTATGAVEPAPPTQNGNQAEPPSLEAGVKVWATAGPMSIASESDQSAQLVLALQTPSMGTPQFKRVSPSSFQIFLPKARYVLPEHPLGSPSITAVEPMEDENGLTLTVRLSRPMGVLFTPSANQIVMTLTKPRVGNGKLAGKLVVVDAGHGGHDSGAKSPGGGVLEKNLTLSVAKLLAEALTSEGAGVIMTRTDDTFISLTERPAVANRNGADFFVSVHINSNRVNDKISGAISFYHGGAQYGELMASCIESETKKVPGIASIGVWSDKKIYDSGFAVLRNSQVPAVLLELGFINHSRDRGFLTDRSYQYQVAQAIVKGLKVYLGDGS